MRFDTANFSDREHDVFRMGAQAGQHFAADPYRDLNQDVFKAETAEYRLRVTYDDVEGTTYLSVTFKDRGVDKSAELRFPSSKEAIERALRFVAKHPAPRPVCWVDY